jgi:hypothetical protein
MKNITEFKRNSEFDRAYWDDLSEERWITSHDRLCAAVKTSPEDQAKLEATFRDRFTCGHEQRHANSDSLSKLFIYPFSENSASTSMDAFTSTNSILGVSHHIDKRHHIKRSEYSEYNEQRIKFHLKFYLIIEH